LIANNERLKAKKAPFVHAFGSIYIRSWQAHQGIINKISKIDTLPCLITCSLDKFINIWSQSGDLHGSINLVKVGQSRSS